MRAVIQRVSSASVSVAGEEVGRIGPGLLVLIAFAREDNPDQIPPMVDKVLRLRVFDDPGGRMNLSLLDVGREVLCISQFTLYGDLRRGNRPSYKASAPRDVAEPFYDAFCDGVRQRGVVCQTGRFGAEMAVTLTNDGPVTIVIDSDDLARPRRA